MKNILLITTGGTIASAESENGLIPALASEQLLSHVPEVKNICKVSTVQLYNLDSTNMRPEYWLEIANHIKKVYDEYDGFVITHGTDTMAYASSLLYYLIQNSKKPVVLTGAQIPIERRDTDARENLTDAFLYACDDSACGVHIVFDGKVISGIAKRTSAQNVPLVAIVGCIDKSASEAYDLGVSAIFGIDREAKAFVDYIHETRDYYQRTMEDILRLIRAAEQIRK